MKWFFVYRIIELSNRIHEYSSRWPRYLFFRITKANMGIKSNDWFHNFQSIEESKKSGGEEINHSTFEWVIHDFPFAILILLIIISTIVIYLFHKQSKFGTQTFFLSPRFYYKILNAFRVLFAPHRIQNTKTNCFLWLLYMIIARAAKWMKTSPKHVWLVELFKFEHL